MASPFDSLLLDVSTWDLTTNANNDIAVASAPYSVAQDMSSQCRQWKGEYIYNAADGVPLATILGETPSLALVKSDFAQAAGHVPGTSNVKCFITSVKDRNVQGQVQASLVGTNTVVVTSIGGQKIVIPSAPRLTSDDSSAVLTDDAGNVILIGS